MKYSAFLLAAISLATIDETLAADDFFFTRAPSQKAITGTPSGGYAPAVVPCPSDRPKIRSGDAISPAEVSWLKLRKDQTVRPMIDWLSRASIDSFDAASYINSVKDSPRGLPNIGVAISGGGYRALMNGAGFLAAADIRTKNSTNNGHIGGLLQATTYVSGLSGGAWLVSSMFVNNFSTIESLRDSGSESFLWKFENSIFEGPEMKGKVFDTARYIKKILDDVDAKNDAGFNISATDFWGRALSFQLIDGDDGGAAKTFSSIATQDGFKDASTPYPILVATRSQSDQTQTSRNSSVFEMNPFELGTWDSNISGFLPMEYLGSNFSAGEIPSDGSCVKGYDQVGFLFGASSTLFEEAINRGVDSPKLSPFRKALESLSEKGNDVAQIQPNPFSDFNPGTNPISKSHELALVDGGLDGQNLPLVPLLQQQREVDVIFSVDSSADADGYPNGTSLVATYERSIDGESSSPFPFPSIPDQHTFINLGFNKRPTFFGCDASNITGDSPIIVYIPNSKYVVDSNLNTFQTSYKTGLRNQVIRNGYEVSTLANGTVDSQWPTCVGCVVLSRSLTRTKSVVPQPCEECFKNYCWNGTLNQTAINTSDSPGSFFGNNIYITLFAVFFLNIIYHSFSYGLF